MSRPTAISGQTRCPVYEGQGFADQPQTFRLDHRFDGTLSVPEGPASDGAGNDLNVIGDT